MTKKLNTNRMSDGTYGTQIDNHTNQLERDIAEIFGIPTNTVLERFIMSVSSTGHILDVKFNQIRVFDTAEGVEAKYSVEAGSPPHLVMSHRTSGTQDSPVWTEVNRMPLSGDRAGVWLKGSVPAGEAQYDNHILSYDDGTGEAYWRDPADLGLELGATSFIGLSDTPSNIASEDRRLLARSGLVIPTNGQGYAASVKSNSINSLDGDFLIEWTQVASIGDIVTPLAFTGSSTIVVDPGLWMFQGSILVFYSNLPQAGVPYTYSNRGVVYGVGRADGYTNCHVDAYGVSAAQVQGPHTIPFFGYVQVDIGVKGNFQLKLTKPAGYPGPVLNFNGGIVMARVG